MALLAPKYRYLHPSTEYLLDKVVLAQAWKKAHQYIRSTNWYADTFELDRSAIDLSEHLESWCKELESESFSFDSLKLVPAPKSSPWHFEKCQGSEFDSKAKISHRWQPEEDKDYQDGVKPLRPLAHISIRDQTLLTALMICMANQVEGFQGDTSTNFDDVHDKKVVNYGNRLYCQFSNREADFSWGNSTTYSKYFSDYRQFLARPAHFGYQAIQRKISDEEVYEVHLDLEKFYDKVKRDVLVKKIRRLVNVEDEILERLLENFVSWEWGESCPDLYEEVCSNGDADIPKGIPQGLVAGGFFANIYLLGFDERLAGLIGNELGDGIKLVDYCRYVDDMRLIVVADSNNAPSVQAAIESVLGAQLEELGLLLNSHKTVVEPYRTKRSGVSVKLRDIQNKLSGPLSINEIDEQLGHLEGLIGLAEGLRADTAEKDNNNPLAIIETPSNDVREDTLLRFSANKIHILLRQKRSLVAQEVDGNGKPIPGSWDYLQERMARKFIACWSRDPSQVLLLKKALEFFPDIKILKPVVDQLLFARDRGVPKQRQIAEYCLCEIFRHTAIHNKDRWALPAHAGVEAYHEWLQQIAINVIEPDFTENEYLGQQARFYLLVCNDSPLEEDTEDQNFNIIIKIMKGYRNVTAEMSSSQLVTNCLLAYQLGNDKKAVLRSVSALLEKIAKVPASKKASKRLTSRSLHDIGLKLIRESMPFFEDLIVHAKGSECSWVRHLSDLIGQSCIFVSPINGKLGRFSAQLPEPVSLVGVIKRYDNPFAHENALLQLLDTILDSNSSAFSSGFDLSNCKVGCSDWKNIQRLSTDLVIDLAVSDDGLFPIPEWVEERHEPLYRAGIFIRSCLLGSIDWSASSFLHINDASYKGLKTGFYKRQLGMMHSPESIGGETAPMSGWLSGLLSHLLQWPGVKLHDGGYPWPKEWDLETLKSVIGKRIVDQRALYCGASGMPAYTERVMLDWPTDKANLKVVMVQSLLPLKKDFSEHGFLLDTPKYRARHRRHVASVAELLLHKVYSQKSIDDERYNSKPDIDLIIWPELSVNEEDIDILKRLSDKTGAIIFTGLVFKELPGVDGPKNVAQWIVPKKNASGRQFLTRLQGKFNLMKDEVGKAKPWRPYQLMLELVHPAFPQEKGFVLTGSICYDATDIKLSADLKDKSDAYIVSALNRDVSTFDSMVDALYYHMYQHVALVNTGEFGGSVAKAPYKERHEKLITHVHGANQVSISSFEMNMFDFRTIGKSLRSGKKLKTKPAG